MKPALLLSALLPLAVIAAEKPKYDLSKIPPAAKRQVDFAKDVYPIFKEACFSCHGPQKQKGKYRMDTKEGAFKPSDDYGPAIKPGASTESSIILMCSNLIDEMMMPPPSDKPGQSEPLTAEQIGILRAWIDQGAVWPDGPIQEVVKAVTFEADIKPIFAQSCAPCHAGASAKGGFAVDTVAAVLKGGGSYGAVVKAGDAAKSSLITIISGKDEDLPAPEKHKLAPKQIELVKQWIQQGAK